MTVYTALGVSSDANPSLHTIQWSEDGQVLIVTRSAIYILTPDIGISFDAGSTLTALPDEKDVTSNAGPPLGWFRTLIGLEKGVEHIWGLESQEYSTLVLGTLENMWRAACWSPTNLSTEGCCLLAALNTNLELSIWETSLNHLKGAWVKLQDITAMLKTNELDKLRARLPAGEEQSVELGAKEIMHTQIQSFTWSKQVNYTTDSKMILDGSLLAIGTRSGRVGLLRYDQQTKSMVTIHVLYLGEHWVTHLAWSDWRMTEPDKCEAILACAFPTGRIRRVAVRQSLVLTKTTQDTPIPLYEQALTTSILPGESPSISDGKSITSMSWISVPDRRPLLVHTKPGMVFIWSLEHGLQCIDLKRQVTCSGSNSLLPPCGLIYLKERDCIILALQDSSVHVIYSVSSLPTLVPTADDKDILSLPLSQLVRSTDSLTINKKLRSDDMFRCSGMVPFDSLGAVMWFSEHWRPHDFAYKPESKRKNTLVVKQLWNDVQDESKVLGFLTKVEELLRGESSDSACAVRTVLFGLRSPTILEGAKEKLLELLAAPPSSATPLRSVSEDNQVMELDHIPMGIRTSFREGVQRSLAHSEGLDQLRIKYNIALSCFRLSKDGRFEGRAEDLLKTISQITLWTILDALSEVHSYLQDADRAFKKRIFRQYALSEGSSDERSSLDVEMRSDSNSVGDGLASKSGEDGVGERCPACQDDILPGGVTHAECQKGHRWMRCSVTSLLLATTKTRTCIGCSRKALAPVAEEDPRCGEYGWVVKEILDANVVMGACNAPGRMI